MKYRSNTAGRGGSRTEIAMILLEATTDERAWQKIEYPAAPMSTACYIVVVNFLASIVNASDQWREYLMIELLNRSAVKNLVSQVKISLARNPGYISIYINNEESFNLKILEVWTTIGDHTYLIIYKAEATKYFAYLPIIQRMLDSFRVGVSLY